MSLVLRLSLLSVVCFDIDEPIDLEFMKYLIGIIIFFFSVNVFAKQQDIVAIVNDKPIKVLD